MNKLQERLKSGEEMFKLRKHSVSKIIRYTVIVFYVLFLTGSAFQNVYMSQLGQLNMVVTLAAFCFWVLTRRGKVFVQSKNIINIFVFYCFLNFIICSLFWNEMDYYNLYFANIAIFVMAALICRKISYHTFIKYFENVMLGLAILSLVGYYTSFLNFLPARSMEGTFSYKTYLFYNVLTTNTERNCGFFWEPGMYQGVLVAAMVILILNKEKFRFVYFRFSVLFITVISTYSTTGYALLLAIVVLAFLEIIEKKSTVMANIIVGVTAIVLLLASNTGLIVDTFVKSMPSIITDKIVNRDISYNTRMYSMAYDWILSFRYPLGVGRLQLNRLVKEVAIERGTMIAARTNTIGTAFVHFGLIGGVIYLYIWLKGMLQQNGSLAKRILVIIIFMTIINTEPHMYTLLFNILAFYWYQMNTRENKDENKADA